MEVILNRSPLKQAYILWLVILPHPISAQWLSTGGPNGGKVISLAANSTTLFASADFGGAYISTDYGESWRTANTGFPMDSRINQIVVGKNAVYAATTNGLFISKNDGNSWSVMDIGLPQNTSIYRIAIKGDTIFAGGQQGSAYSTDNGVTWINGSESFADLIVIFALSGGHIVGGCFELPVMPYSKDGGVTWLQSETGKGIVNDMAVHQGIVYAATQRGIWISNNHGESWASASTGLSDTTVGAILSVGERLYAGTASGVFVSSDGAATWSAAENTGLSETNILSITTCDNRLFAGTNKGVFRSSDGGNTWTSANNGIANSETIALAKSGDALLAGTFEGVHRSLDNGLTWQAQKDTEALGEFHVECFTVNETSVFAGTKLGGVFRSKDHGATWTAVNEGLSDTDISVLAAAGETIFAGGRHTGMYRSDDNGDSWISINTGLPDSLPLTLAVSNGNVYTGFFDDGLFISTDDGDSWNETGIHADLSIAVSGNKVFVGCWGVYSFSADKGETWTTYDGTTYNTVMFDASGEHIIAGAFTGGVFRSSDNGQSWYEVSDGLFDGNITSFTLIENTLFAGSYYSGVLQRPITEITPIRRPPDNFGSPQPQICFIENSALGLTARYTMQTLYPVELNVYSTTGRLITSYKPGLQAAGDYRIRISSNMPPVGMYTYQFQAGPYEERKLFAITE